MKKFYTLLAIGVALKIALFSWLYIHELPTPTADFIAFSEPYYAHQNGYGYTLPSIKGFMGSDDTSTGIHYSFFRLFNAFVFSIFGYSWSSILLYTFAIHIIINIILFVIIYHYTKSFWALVFGFFAPTFIIFSVGRPEETSFLFFILSFIVYLKYNKLILPSILLGISFASGLIPGFLGIFIFSFYYFLNNREIRKSVIDIIKIYAIAVFVNVISTAYILYPNYASVFGNFSNTASQTYKTSFFLELSKNPVFVAPIALIILLNVAALAYLLYKNRDFNIMTTRINATLLLSIVLIFFVNNLPFTGRPLYDYRMLNYIMLISTPFVFYQFLDLYKHIYARIGGYLILSGVVFCYMILQFYVIRFALVPLTWTDKHFTYEESVAIVHELIPDDASIGGDPAFSFHITDGRIFHCIRWTQPEYWPDYLISGHHMSSSGITYIKERADWRAKIDTEYEEITDGVPKDILSCTLNVFGKKIPITNSGSDWNVRVWKKKYLDTEPISLELAPPLPEQESQ